MLHFSSPFSNIAGASEYWKARDNTTARMSNRTERLRPVVCADVEPRHALQIEEAEEHAQYVTDNDTAEEIALPMVDFVVDALVIIFRFFKIPVLHLPQHIERGRCAFRVLSRLSL